ncbi:MAG: CoA pyrophosphatase [Bacteroidia bacterium]
MTLNEITKIIHQKINSGNLPGPNAQYAMSSIGRKSRVHSEFGKKEHKKSAVLILLYEKNGQVYFPLTQRRSYKGVHSGQVSLPGGKQELEDYDLSHTAIRETHEEVGVNRNSIQLIGQLTDLYIPPSNHHVHPYVGCITHAPNFVNDEREVEELLETPLEILLDDSIISETKIDMGNGLKIKTPYFNMHERVIWGATAMILNEFKELIAPSRRAL